MWWTVPCSCISEHTEIFPCSVRGAGSKLADILSCEHAQRQEQKRGTPEAPGRFMCGDTLQTQAYSSSKHTNCRLANQLNDRLQQRLSSHIHTKTHKRFLRWALSNHRLMYKSHFKRERTHFPAAPLAHSLRLHAQWSRATVKAQLSHLTGLLSLSQYTSTKRESIYCPSALQWGLICSIQLVAIGPSSC